MFPETKYFEVRGLRVAFHTWGDREKPVILFFHGFMDNGLSFNRTARLLEDDFFLVAPDFRGHGRSDWIGDGGYYHFNDYFSDVDRLIDVIGCEVFSVVGHSMGGAIALGIAAMKQENVQRLILLEGLCVEFEPISAFAERLRVWSRDTKRPDADGGVLHRKSRRRTMDTIEDAARHFRAYNPRLSEERALELALAFAEKVEKGFAWRFDPLHRTRSSRPYFREYAHALWGEIVCPVTSVVGGESSLRASDEEERHRMLKAEVVRVEDAGHNIHHEQPDTVANIVRASVLSQPI